MGPYATFDLNPIWHTDMLGDKTSFSNDADKAYVMQFVNKRNADGSKNKLYSKEYAKKYRRLEKSNTDYHFESFDPDKSPDKFGGYTVPDNYDPNRIDVYFTTGLRTPLQKDRGVGLSPFASLWEETFHAWDYETGGLDFKNHTALDEAQAWKFSVTAPQTKYTIDTYVPEDKKTYTDFTAAFRILNTDEKQVAQWLKYGMSPYMDPTTKRVYNGLGIKDVTQPIGIKGIYFDIPLGFKK